VSERELKDRLRRVRAPQETDAAERSWRVVREAHARRSPFTRRHARRRLAGGLLAALAGLGLVLSPAGAEVREWVADVVDDPPGVERAEPSLDRLPGGGRLLVDSAEGSWLVDPDGSRRRLGDYEQSAWSPRGLFAAAVQGNTLSAVDVSEEIGDVRWSLSADAQIAEPQWSPSGVRIAYLAGDSLRVVDGDQSDDRLLRPRVGDVAPAWMPEPEYTGLAGEPAPKHVLAYVGTSGRTARVVEADTGRLLWTQAFTRPIRGLEWTEQEDRLAVLTATRLKLFSRQGRSEESFGFSRGNPALSSDAAGHDRFAVTRWSRKRGRSQLDLLDTPAAEPLFPGPGRFSGVPGRFSGVEWSPSGNWILLEWKAADQWLFLSPDGKRVRAVSQIAGQFDPGGDGDSEFPAVSGWCCE